MNNQKWDSFSRASFDNAFGLFKDGKSLYQIGSYSRAYAILIMSAEELAKSATSKGMMLGVLGHEAFADFKGYHNFLTTHVYKQSFFLVLSILLQKKGLMDIIAVWAIASDMKKKNFESTQIYEQIERVKQHCLYVDFDTNGDIIIPEKNINASKCKEFVDALDSLFPLFNKLLTSNASDYRSLLSLNENGNSLTRQNPSTKR